MIINLVLFFIPKRQEIYRLYLIKKRKKLACMRLNSKKVISTSNTSKILMFVDTEQKRLYISSNEERVAYIPMSIIK